MREAAFRSRASADRTGRPFASGISYLISRGALGWQTLQSILREIFDESAYDRFLQRRRLTSSSHAYAEFLNEFRQQRERRPRCC